MIRGLAKGQKAADAASTAEVLTYAKRVLDTLGLGRLPLPNITWTNKLGVCWLGRCHMRGRDFDAHWEGRLTSEGKAPTSTFELHRQILSDKRTFERVVAHETVHHADYLTMRPSDWKLAVMLKNMGHDRRFEELAAIINHVVGDAFVTKTSDESYACDTRAHKPFWLYIVRIPRRGESTYTFAWAGALGAKAMRLLHHRFHTAGISSGEEETGPWLVTSQDLRFTQGAQKIDSGSATVREELQDALAEIVRSTSVEASRKNFENYTLPYVGCPACEERVASGAYGTLGVQGARIGQASGRGRR